MTTYPEYIRVAGRVYRFYVPSFHVRYHGTLYRIALQVPTPEESDEAVAKRMVQKCTSEHTTIGPRAKTFCVYQPNGDRANFLGRHTTYEEALDHAKALLFRLRYLGRPLTARSRTAIIDKCAPGDRDKDRPAKDQIWCLFTRDGKKVKGRHPTEEAAQAQEAAIHARGASILYRGARYVQVA
jgi:hypothetical protein